MKSDLIMRLIEQVAQALAEVAGLAKHGSTAGAQERLDQAFSTLAGMSRPLAEQLTAESIRASFAGKPGYHERLEILAKLLVAQADLYDAQGNSAAAHHCRVAAAELT